MNKTALKVLRFVERYNLENNPSPTLAGIAEGIGYTSRGSVHRYVQQLIQSGHLESDGQNQNLRCTGKPITEFLMPFMGEFVDGEPLKVSAKQKQVDISDIFFGVSRFVLRFTGNSMIGAGIYDQDYVVILKSNVARENDLVVATIDGVETVLRRYSTTPDNRVYLKPENPTLQTRSFPHYRVQILGIVVGQMREYDIAEDELSESIEEDDDDDDDDYPDVTMSCGIIDDIRPSLRITNRL